MDDERWESLVDLIDERFGIEQTEKRETTRHDGSPEWHESIIFVKGGTRMRVERISRPRVLEVKTYYARRRGGSQTETIYSKTERTHTVKLYEWRNGWEEVDLSQISR
ncbi:MAG: hypothetical protein QHJ73_01255 [Armatimonadota bacterium]|nr:hypothetical protein [Armatimonadota bacterium]